MDQDGATTGDIEGNKSEQAFFLNDTISSFSWQQLTVTVKDRHTKQPKDLISNINGSVEQGLSELS